MELIVNDAAQKKNALWNATSDIDTYLTSLEIDFAYGMSGEFLLATKKSDFEWSDIPEIELNVNDTTTVIDLNTNNMCSIDGFDFTLKGDGGKLILAVTEILK